jgi:hypothetical protein
MIAEAAYGRGKDDVYRDMATDTHRSLCGDVMLEAAARLQKQEHLNVLVRNAGLTAKQAERSLHSMRASWNVACGLSSRDIIY